MVASLTLPKADSSWSDLRKLSTSLLALPSRRQRYCSYVAERYLKAQRERENGCDILSTSSPLFTTLMSPLPPSTPRLPFPPQHHVSPSPLNTTSPLPPSTPRLPYPPQHHASPTPLNTTSSLPPSTLHLPFPPHLCGPMVLAFSSLMVSSLAAPTTLSCSLTEGITSSNPCRSGNKTCSTLGSRSALSTMAVTSRCTMASSSEQDGLRTISDAFTTSSTQST